ncbi:hypothetical protein AWB98_02520 [Mycolicibacterium conceptionense]|uniref:Uncharacterized protein n=1 Tax=Mycolicibacterium conceptionense TaxID=451644 RepID=A0ABX3UYF2_9MYCO|nr:hypothetical protein [Mycolicibacterium conceptionense]ORV19664.1 hypothetical protein AWB98_02520 [Mycolicibacterium conceptionense]
MGASGYVSQIDRLLSSAVSVFPDPSRDVEWVGLDRPTIPAAPADGGGQLAEALDQATDTYARMAAETEAVQAAIRDAAQSAAETARQAAIDMASIRDAAQSQGTAIMPAEDLESAEPRDLKLLVETMDSKLEAAQDVLGTTRENFERSAERLRAAYL